VREQKKSLLQKLKNSFFNRLIIIYFLRSFEDENIQDFEEEDFCTRCQELIKPNQKFCFQCGEKLRFHCFRCGELCEERADQCPSCSELFKYDDDLVGDGLLFNDNNLYCDKCSNVSDSGWDYCINCGTKFYEEDIEDEDNF